MIHGAVSDYKDTCQDLLKPRYLAKSDLQIPEVPFIFHHWPETGRDATFLIRLFLGLEPWLTLFEGLSGQTEICKWSDFSRFIIQKTLHSNPQLILTVFISYIYLHNWRKIDSIFFFDNPSWFILDYENKIYFLQVNIALTIF